MTKKIQFTVHEFMSIMGRLDTEKKGAAEGKGDSVYDAWYDHWIALEKKVDKLSPMARADMLFDGKVGINAISEAHLTEVIGIIEKQVKMHQKLIDDNDEDADPEDLDMWRARLVELTDLRQNMGW